MTLALQVQNKMSISVNIFVCFCYQFFGQTPAQCLTLTEAHLPDYNFFPALLLSHHDNFFKLNAVVIGKIIARVFVHRGFHRFTMMI